MKKKVSQIRRLISKINYLTAIISFLAAISYGAWYVAVYEIRLSNVERLEDKNQVSIEKLDDRLDAIYAWLRKDKYKELLGVQ